MVCGGDPDPVASTRSLYTLFIKHANIRIGFPRLAGPPCSSFPSRPSSSRSKLHWKDALGSNVLSLPRTVDVFTKIELDEKLSYHLPPKHALPGRVVKDCVDYVAHMINKHKPLIYKIGYCHDAHTRFYNRKFGYALDPERWEHLVTLYAADEIISPGFLEAALIQQFKGTLDGS